jgi:hypothetical protein
MHLTKKRRIEFVLIVVVTLSAFALPAQAPAVTIQLGPPDLSASDPFATCDALSPEFCTAKTFIPTALPEVGALLVTPADGTITSWRVRGAPPGKLRLRVVQALEGGQFKGVASSGVAKVSDGKSDNAVAISISAGQQLGVNLENTFPQPSSTLLGNAAASEAAWSAYFPGLADEATASPSFSGSGSEPLFNATVALYKPQLLNLSSTAGPQTGGELVALNGLHLAVATSVSFGGVPAQIVSARSSQILVATPPHEPGPVSVTVTTAGGSNDDSPANLYTYASVPPPPPDTAAPELAALSIVPAAFTARQGATLSFRASERGRARFTLERKPRRGPFKKMKGALVVGFEAGKNRLSFAGKWNGKRLKPARYRLLAVATDAIGNRSAKPTRRLFTVLPPRTAR